jgi:hypothetical protein
VGTLPSCAPNRRLVPAARLDELLGRAATVGVSIGHGAAQLPDGSCFRPDPFGPISLPVVQVVFGGRAGGEEQSAGRSGAVAVTGNRDHVGRASTAAPGIGFELLAADAVIGDLPLSASSDDQHR